MIVRQSWLPANRMGVLSGCSVASTPFHRLRVKDRVRRNAALLLGHSAAIAVSYLVIEDGIRSGALRASGI
jgi:hypothetical protein